MVDSEDNAGADSENQYQTLKSEVSTIVRIPHATVEAPMIGMSLVEHLGELRRRILICAGTVFAAFCLAFCYSVNGIEALKHLAPLPIHLVQLSPGEVFMASLRISVYGAIALASPLILYHAVRFTLPGLTVFERRLLIAAVAGGGGLFLLGLAFAWCFVVPSSLFYLLDYGHTVAANQLSIERYVAFCVSVLLVTGALFELPLVLFLLSFLKLVTSQKMLAQWRWACTIIFVVAAIVTPSQDPFTMTIVGLAMVALYMLSILPIKLCGR